MSATDDLLKNNERHAAAFERQDLAAPPQKRVAVVACMDARLDPTAALGLHPGDAHVIRNAGGVVTDEVIRSLAISQHKLGTTEVVLIAHTDCGLEGLDRDEFARQLDEEAGTPRDWSIGAFEDVDQSVRDSIARLEANPFIREKGSIRGFVYELDTGRLREVT